jgi:TolB-like protein
MRVYKFGNCYLNPAERCLLKNGQFVKLTPKTFDVLLLLVENSGRIVTKDEILGQVWKGSFVEEGNLAVYVSRLRRLLDENKNRSFIETASGNGYRFLSIVSVVGGDEWRRQLPVEGLLNSDRSNGEELTLDSIAVLPLENESGDPEIEYLANGLTEGLISRFSQNSNLKVFARNTVFRYKNNDGDAREIGETLGAAAVLTGRIRTCKDRLTVSVELIKTEDGRQIWGEQINRPFTGVAETREQIISAVSEKLKLRFRARNRVINFSRSQTEISNC